MVDAFIQDILIKSMDHPAFMNTYQHLWCYFKKIATPSEKERYTTLLTQLDMQA
ncbi:DUF1722 domain-containing protein, partial [Staphylococcus pseudintermedius]|uniref:DUF1722 domain-containing protein n=1 Tax=Staphylococcus pseudintermedius TaxID=283734 RepID=UPI002286DEB1